MTGVCVGVVQRLIRDSLAYATRDRQLGKPIAEFQLIGATPADRVGKSASTAT